VTYGCIVYQEQVIEICRRLAGFSLGQADMIRRAMSKKKEKEIVRERKTFIHGDPERNIPGAVANGIPEDVAGSIYDEILDFANYAFNKAHAVSYAIVSYRTAYMKVHYPREYMAALLTSVLDSSTKVAEYISECKDMGIKLLPPDVNESEADFTVSGENLRFGLAAVKNVGRGFVKQLVLEREQNGKFKSLDEFCTRMYGRDLNRRAIESLIRAGAFDSFGHKRKQLLQVLDAVLDGVSSAGRKNVQGQLDLFGFGDEEEDAAPAQIKMPDVEEFTRAELMSMEREMTGLYLSGHPMDEYRDKVRMLGTASIGAIVADFASDNGPTKFADGQQIKIAGVVASHKTRTTKNNTMMAYITLEDDTGAMELLAFSRALDAGGAYVADGAALFVKGKISVRDEKEPQIMVDSIRPLSDLDTAAEAAEKNSPTPQRTERAEKKAQTLWLRLPTRDEKKMRRIELLLQMFPGDDGMIIYFEDTKKRAGARCIIHPALEKELKELFGEGNVVIK
ncbi:MAG: DNA polymerase III subunit alpha, partial [Oscillospiraceae bacterium]|nr:DNA polymerase III subunit alpha [Oscillospiraceae bacterium]